MPFTFSYVKPLNTGRVSSIDVPLGEYLSNAFNQGVHDSMFSSIMDMEELSLSREGRLMSPDEANETYGLPTLKFDRQIHESTARLLNERKQAELRRAFYLDMGAPGGLFSKRGLAGLGAGFVGSILNPLDFSVNFLPIVGSAGKAAEAGALGRGAFRQGLARGLITEEMLDVAVPMAPRLTSSMIQGTVGSIVAEIPHLVSALESKENYTLTDSFTNVVAGGVLAGALHLGISQAVRIYERLHPATKETMLRTGMDQFVRGKDVDVTKFVEIDEVTIRERVKFDEQVARERAVQSLNMSDVAAAIKKEYGETMVRAALKLTDGRILTGDTHWLVDTSSLTDVDFNGLQEGFVTDKGRFVTRDEAARITGVSNDMGELTSEELGLSSDPEFLVSDDRSIFDAVKEAGATDAEAMQEVRRIQGERADEAFFARPDVQEKIQQETERRVQELMSAERAKYDEEGAYVAARDIEIQRQIAEGKILTPEQLKEWNLSAKTVEESTATIKEQNQALMEELKDLEEELSAEGTKAPDVEKKLLDKVEDILKKLKIEGGNVQEGISGMPVWLWNGAVDAVIAAVRAGKKIGEAIDAGIKHLRASKKDFELTEKIEQQFARKVRKQLGVKEPGVSRRTFIDLVGKVTGLGVTTPMGVVQAVGKELAKTDVGKAVKKALLPNMSLKQLTALASKKLAELEQSSGAVGSSERSNFLMDPLHNFVDEFDSPVLVDLLRESPSFKKLDAEERAKPVKDPQEARTEEEFFSSGELGPDAVLWGERFKRKDPKSIIYKLENTPLAELELVGEIPKNLAEDLNKFISSVADLYPEIRSAIDLASNATEAKIVKDVVAEKVKSEADAIEQALKCLIINV